MGAGVGAHRSDTSARRAVAIMDMQIIPEWKMVFNPSDVRKMRRWAQREASLAGGIGYFVEDYFFNRMNEVTELCFSMKQEPDGTPWLAPSKNTIYKHGEELMWRTGTLFHSINPQGGGKSYLLFGIDADAINPKTGDRPAEYGVLQNFPVSRIPARRFLVEEDDPFWEDIEEYVVRRMRELNPIPR